MHWLPTAAQFIAALFDVMRDHALAFHFWDALWRRDGDCFGC